MISHALILSVFTIISSHQESTPIDVPDSPEVSPVIVDSSTSEEFIEMTPELIESCRRGMDFLVASQSDVEGENEDRVDHNQEDGKETAEYDSDNFTCAVQQNANIKSSAAQAKRLRTHLPPRVRYHYHYRQREFRIGLCVRSPRSVQ